MLTQRNFKCLTIAVAIPTPFIIVSVSVSWWKSGVSGTEQDLGLQTVLTHDEERRTHAPPPVLKLPVIVVWLFAGDPSPCQGGYTSGHP